MNDVRLDYLRDVFNDPKRSAVEKRIAGRRVIRQVSSELTAARKHHDSIKDKVEALDWLIQWMEAKETDGLLAWQANQQSAAHRLAEAFRIERLYNADSNGNELEPDLLGLTLNLEKFQVFVVNHRWSSVIPDVKDDEVKLPYEACMFEFRYNNAAVICTAWQYEGMPANCFINVEAGNGSWLGIGSSSNRTDAIYAEIWGEVRAISVALDAEVAVTSVTRAPAALNRKRAKAGKTPLKDYHVVDLTRRNRIGNPTAGHDGARKRLHFRRGHWRHYEKHTTWIRWTLVGDPDLGFIDKHYAL